jgi:hypothetical protein
MNLSEPRNRKFSEGDLVALLKVADRKPSKAVVQLDKLLPLLTDDDLENLHREITIRQLVDADPVQRRELLSGVEVCPCCDRWLGHNRPPAEDSDPPYRRQTSFDL